MLLFLRIMPSLSHVIIKFDRQISDSYSIIFNLTTCPKNIIEACFTISDVSGTADTMVKGREVQDLCVHEIHIYVCVCMCVGEDRQLTTGQ